MEPNGDMGKGANADAPGSSEAQTTGQVGKWVVRTIIAGVLSAVGMTLFKGFAQEPLLAYLNGETGKAPAAEERPFGDSGQQRAKDGDNPGILRKGSDSGDGSNTGEPFR